MIIPSIVVASSVLKDTTDLVIAVTGLVIATSGLVAMVVNQIKILRELRTNTQISTAAAIAADSTHQTLTQEGVGK